jgi:hypothetical protein
VPAVVGFTTRVGFTTGVIHTATGAHERPGSPSALIHSEGAGILANLWKMAEAEAVQTNGFEVLLCALM